MRRGIVGVVGCLACSCTGPAPRHETGFLNRTISLEGVEYAYQVYVPQAYEPSSEWPVILFLHGAGERGDDGLKQTQTGLGAAIRTHPERWPAITVFPQVPEEMTWQGTPGLVAMAALEAAMAEFRIDESRVYLTGLSLGGNGTWYLGFGHPQRFAALVAVCGFLDSFHAFSSFLPDSSADPFLDVASRIADIPTWIVHGDADPVVPVEQSRKMASALSEVGAEVHYVELPEVGHNAWDAAYASEDLASWLFAQRKQ